jgi:hypothetical protein
MDALKTPFLTQELIVSESNNGAHLAANALIQSEYRKHFKCELKSLAPTTVSLMAGNDLVAATGYRDASQESLYLEQYLDLPIEQLISNHTKQPVDRSQIVEIGGFALGSSEYVLPFMFQLAPMFDELGYQWATCTVTRTIKRYLDKLGVESIYFAKADPARVIGAEDSWGSYYDHQPVVLAGNIQAVVEKLAPFRTALAAQ